MFFFMSYIIFNFIEAKPDIATESWANHHLKEHHLANGDVSMQGNTFLDGTKQLHRMGNQSLMRHFMPVYIWSMRDILEWFMFFLFLLCLKNKSIGITCIYLEYVEYYGMLYVVCIFCNGLQNHSRFDRGITCSTYSRYIQVILCLYKKEIM